MNNHQRKQIFELTLKISEIYNDLIIIAEEEQEKVDNAPENLQYSEKYEQIQETADELQTQADELQSITETLEEYT